MKCGRRPWLVVAILLYVSLDLSLATIPGAFVFDAGNSVESTKGNRGRGTGEVVTMPAPAREPCVEHQPRVPVSLRLAAPAEVTWRRRAVVTWRPRTPLSPPPLSEDPH